MYIRQIFSQLAEHLNASEVTVITGMRRVGKTTALQYLLSQVAHENKIMLDLERIEYRMIFKALSFSETEAGLRFLGIDFTKPAVIALDEVQLVPEVVSFVKYYHDHHGIKFILSGSSSFYLKNTLTESLAGRKQIFEMYPLSFAEFLVFKGLDPKPLVDIRFGQFLDLAYARYQAEYEEFLLFGGFPQVVLASEHQKKRVILSDILNSYLDLDVKLLSDYSAIDDLHKLIKLIAARVGSKLDYQKMGSLVGLTRHKVKDYLHLFEATYFIHLVQPYAQNVDREIAVQPKLYFADTGLLTLLGASDSGAIFENAIALQLKQHGVLQYYQRKSGQEIDFILNQSVAYEVKETATKADFSALHSKATALQINDYQVISRYRPAQVFEKCTWGGQV